MDELEYMRVREELLIQGPGKLALRRSQVRPELDRIEKVHCRMGTDKQPASEIVKRKSSLQVDKGR